MFSTKAFDHHYNDDLHDYHYRDILRYWKHHYCDIQHRPLPSE